MRDQDAKPGASALDALRALAPDELRATALHPYIVGEQALPTEARRHLVADRGIAKDQISWCGYWRVGAASPTPKSQLADAQAHA